MEINYYRQNNAQGYDEAWSACQFTSNTDLSQFSVKPLVTINANEENEKGEEGKASPLCHGSAVAINKLSHDVNNSLTLPTHPQPACPW